MRDGEAPSYYNPVEASTLVRLLQGLLSYNTACGQGVTVQDIGVIATYRNQAGVFSYCNNTSTLLCSIVCLSCGLFCCLTVICCTASSAAKHQSIRKCVQVPTGLLGLVAVRQWAWGGSTV